MTGPPRIGKTRLALTVARTVAGEFRDGAVLVAVARYSECLNLAREMQDIWTLCLALENLGRLAADQGDLKRAARMLAESLGYAHALGHRWLISRVLESMAEVALSQARPERAALSHLPARSKTSWPSQF